jgi:hypothetical protein
VGGPDEIEEVEGTEGAAHGDGAEAVDPLDEVDPLEEVNLLEEVEVLDAIPVLAPEQSRALVSSLPPTVRMAAVAAGGFVAGAAIVGLVHRRARHVSPPPKRERAGRGLARTGRPSRGGRGAELVQIVASRSLLVDVHLLGGGADR